MNIGHGIALPPTEQGSQEWLEQRRYGIGGSDVAALMGADAPHKLSLSPWSGPHDVFASKVHGVDTPATVAMECGHALEPLGLRLLADAAGLDIITDVPAGYHHPNYEWCRGSLDGVVMDGGEVVAGAEAKTSSDYSWDTVPIYYIAQVQWYMFVLGLPRFYLGCIHGRGKFDWWIIEADEAFQDDLFLAALDFWTDCIIPEDPPAADWSAQCIGNLMAAQEIEDNSKAKVLEALDEALDELLIERELLKAFTLAGEKERKERIKTLDALIMSGMTHKRHEGSTHRVTMVSKARLDRKTLEAQHPEEFAACMVTRPARPTFSVQELKARYPDLAAAHTHTVASHLMTTERKK